MSTRAPARRGGRPRRYTADEIAADPAGDPHPRPDRRRKSPPARVGDLSPRQSATLALLAAGQSNAEIADRLGISAQTVKNHLTMLYARLGVRHGGSPRVLAAVWYHRQLAALLEHRRFIGVEKDPEIFAVARERLHGTQPERHVAVPLPLPAAD